MGRWQFCSTSSNMVVHDEQQRPPNGNDNSSSGGSRGSSKKSKHKKIPQRGMGVAQLEELRLKEQQKTAFSNPNSGEPNYPFRPIVDPNPLSAENPSTGSDRGFLPMIWSAIESGSHDSSSSGSWRPPGILQRRQQYQQQQQFSVNKRLSPSYSSGVSLQMEPPSNQSYSSNLSTPFAWPGEERLAGMKRPWPFNPECFSGNHVPFPCKAPMVSATYLTPNESMSAYGNGSIKFGLKTLREGTSSSVWRSNNHHRDTDDGFLTLGPSMVSSASNSKNPNPPLRLYEHPEFGLPQIDESADDSDSRLGGSSHPQFYSFLPMAPVASEDINGVDLNLSL